MSAIIYLVRHGEVEHHRDDLGITDRGHAQAHRVAEAISARIDQDDAVHIYYAPVKRACETAASIYQLLSTRFNLTPIQPDDSLNNVRFMAHVNGKDQLQEPSLLYAQLTGDATYFNRIPTARADFYRNFWASDDPMGYWLTHQSDGGAESAETVLNRLVMRVREIFTANANITLCTHWILVTHSGAMRVFLRHAFGGDPGEPVFCGLITLELSEQPNCAALSYQNKTVEVKI